jgi:CheY-like chemotaxis protein
MLVLEESAGYHLDSFKRFLHLMNDCILVAEDEHFLRELIHLDLKDRGFDVRLAADGAQTIEVLEECHPKVLLLDLLMPKVDGYRVLEHIRHKGYSFPVIVLSNLSDPTEQQKCRDLGAQGFLVKSNLDEGEIWENVQKFLAS